MVGFVRFCSERGSGSRHGRPRRSGQWRTLGAHCRIHRVINDLPTCRDTVRIAHTAHVPARHVPCAHPFGADGPRLRFVSSSSRRVAGAAFALRRHSGGRRCGRRPYCNRRHCEACMPTHDSKGRRRCRRRRRGQRRCGPCRVFGHARIALFPQSRQRRRRRHVAHGQRRRRRRQRVSPSQVVFRAAAQPRQRHGWRRHSWRRRAMG